MLFKCAFIRRVTLAFEKCVDSFVFICLFWHLVTVQNGQFYYHIFMHACQVHNAVLFFGEWFPFSGEVLFSIKQQRGTGSLCG